MKPGHKPLRKEHPERWKLLWQVAFGKYENINGRDVHTDLCDLVRLRLVNDYYMGHGCWSYRLSDVGKQQL